MIKVKIQSADNRRKTKVRARIKNSGQGRKLSVYRSGRYIYAQIVDLYLGKTLLGMSDKDLIKKNKELVKKNKTERAFELGKAIAKKAVAQDIKRIVFDRGSYKYHGRVKSLADGAREGGLKF